MQRSATSSGLTTPVHTTQPPEAEFDQWAKAVRQQMVAALKRRGRA
ncbi:hypothetical protein GFS31_01790 [Leptolyngbya sp. BL0902]|nr:hypothetical protein [Leptolyngbya sp. BL0902]QQE63514.1 hypothetical protein GFS31_01790 [Leptolyngbya sp. BL0902]